MSEMVERDIASLTPAQLKFMREGKEDIFADRRITRALCGKGLMGLAGYVTGGFELYAFTQRGRDVRVALSPTIAGQTGEGA